MTVLFVTFTLSVALCGAYLVIARRLQLLDRPNERSSHTRPTPHGGGIPMLIALVAGCLLATKWYGPWEREYLVMVSLGLLLMALGIADDLKHLPVRLRLALYGLCSVFVSAYLLDSLYQGWHHLAVTAAVAFSMLWLLNLYNFMDGIDGIAATQCILACGGAAFLAWQESANWSYVLFCLLMTAAQLGFLVWNWPPAKMFMGDAGSIPTGFLLACLALLGGVKGYLNAVCWLILLAPFIVDATATLLWRLCTGQNIATAHRLHAYQRLSRHYDSHRTVDLGLIALSILWLLPLAWAAQLWPDYSLILLLIAYLPLGLGMVKTHQFA